MNDERAHRPESIPFYLSSLASGFHARYEEDGYDSSGHLFAHCQLEHRAAFALLYATNPDLKHLTYESIANIVAMSQVYGFFDLIAPALRAHLLSMPGLWADVRDQFCFHLGLASHLQCKEVFGDALRHYIGSNLSIKALSKLDFELEYVIKVVQKRERFQSTIDKLNADLQALTLTDYIPHADKEDHGQPSKTSYLASAYDFGYIHQATNIAHRIVMEFLIQQVSATPHWSHIRHYSSHYESSFLERGSLREICNLATRAVQRGTELDLFDPNAAKRLVDQAELITRSEKPYAVQFVESELKKLVGQIANKGLPYTASPDFKPTVACGDAESGEIYPEGRMSESSCGGCSTNGGHSIQVCRGRGHSGIARHNHRGRKKEVYTHFERVGMTAHDDCGCHYFTCVDIEDEDLPWDTQEDFEDFKIEDVKEASDEWLVAIGVLEKDDRVDGEEGEDGA